MPEFYVEGPFTVPCIAKGHGKVVDTKRLKEFWEDLGENRSSGYGCYVFGMQVGRGLVPIYVGKATRSFKQECFTLHKLLKINESLLHWKRGTTVLFLVPLERRRGRVNASLIATAEEFLIQNAVVRNPKLANVRGTEQESWGIAGVLRGGKGKPSASARDFKRMMGM